MLPSLTITSCISEKADSICEAIASYLSERLKTQVIFINDIPWEERAAQLEAGQIDIGWICGLLYVWKTAKPGRLLELLAAPVMRGRWYQNSPIYYSDVIVHADSPFQQFADLRGASWAYNEPGSYSGYYLVRYHLATLGETGGYFGKVVESGAHSKSLELVVSREVDTTAIDSTALDLELQFQPELRAQIRTIKMLGPSPVPPWVISQKVDPEIRQALRQQLLTINQDPQGQAILAQSKIARFAAVTDQDYAVMQDIVEKAQQVEL